MRSEMVTKNTALIDLKGIEIEAVDENGMPFANLKRLCEALGMNYNSQLAKLKAKHWATVAMIATVGSDGKTREMTFISADSIPMWLAGINESKIREELRPRLRVLQLEARDVLYAHFSGDVSVNGMLLSEIGSQIAKGIRDGLDSGLKPINEKIDKGFEDVDKNFVAVNQRIDKLEKRRELSALTKRQHIDTVATFFNHKCPCCCQADVLGDDWSKLPDSNWEHFYSPSKNRAHETWLTCRDCNLKLRDDFEFKHAHETAFKAYQMRREQKVTPLLG